MKQEQLLRFLISTGISSQTLSQSRIRVRGPANIRTPRAPGRARVTARKSALAPREGGMLD